MSARHIIKVEDFTDYRHETVLATDSTALKKMIQKTTVKEVTRGRFELVNIIEVYRLGKLLVSTAHLSLAIKEYNKY